MPQNSWRLFIMLTSFVVCKAQNEQSKLAFAGESNTLGKCSRRLGSYNFKEPQQVYFGRQRLSIRTCYPPRPFSFSRLSRAGSRLSRAGSSFPRRRESFPRRLSSFPRRLSSFPCRLSSFPRRRESIWSCHEKVAIGHGHVGSPFLGKDETHLT